MYLLLIRPHLEYACTVWDPFLQKDIQLLEKVQKFAAKVCTKQWNWSYEELLHTLQLPSLQERCKRMKLVLLYKYIDNMAYFSEPPLAMLRNVKCTIQLVHHIAVICIILVGILANTSLRFFPNQKPRPQAPPAAQSLQGQRSQRYYCACGCEAWGRGYPISMYVE